MIPITLWSLFIVAIIVIGIATVNDGDDLSSLWVITIFGVLLNSFLSFSFCKQLFPANRNLKNYPRLLLKRTGTLTSEAICLEEVGVTSWMPLSALMKFTRKRRTMVLAFDRWGLSTKILLSDRFSGPVPADQIFEYHANSSETVSSKSVIDSRLLQEMRPFRFKIAPTSESVPFDGILKTDDLRLTPFNRARIRLNIRLFLLGICLLALTTLMLCFGASNSPVIVVFWLLPPLAVVFFIHMIYSRRVKLLGKKGVDLVWSKGWIDSESITNCTAIEQTRVDWNVFKAVGSNDHAIWLLYPGKLQFYIVIAAHRFVDRAAFESARLIVDHSSRQLAAASEK